MVGSSRPSFGLGTHAALTCWLRAAPRGQPVAVLEGDHVIMTSHLRRTDARVLFLRSLLSVKRIHGLLFPLDRQTFRVVEELETCAVSHPWRTMVSAPGRDPFRSVETCPPGISHEPPPAFPTSRVHLRGLLWGRPHGSWRVLCPNLVVACGLLRSRGEDGPCAARGRTRAPGEGLSGLGAETTMAFPLWRSQAQSLSFSQRGCPLVKCLCLVG